MSLSLITIKKDRNLIISNFLEKYFLSLDNSFTKNINLPYLYENNKSSVSLVFETAKNLHEVNNEEFILQQIKWINTTVYIIKAVVENNFASRNALIAKIKELEVSEIQSRFIALEHTAMITKSLAERPPRLTNGRKIYMPVGLIGDYFVKNSPSYLNENRGSAFSDQQPNYNLTRITDEYFSDYLDTNNFSQLTELEFTGLKHFTTVIYEEDQNMKILFLQNTSKFNFASYIFKPDIVVCSNEDLLKEYVDITYPSENVEIRNSLKELKIDLPFLKM